MPVRVLLIDNYDSFTYNLVQALGVLGATVDVVRNDYEDARAALARGADAVVVSPGPCTPNEAGISVDVCRDCEVPLLGVCLGHQGLAVAFGGEVVRADRVVHGKTSLVHHAATGIFAGLPSPFPAARYHSLIATNLPDCFEATARTDRGELMAFRHKERPLFGVQFHPESYLTPDGPLVLRNFLALA